MLNLILLYARVPWFLSLLQALSCLGHFSYKILKNYLKKFSFQVWISVDIFQILSKRKFGFCLETRLSVNNSEFSLIISMSIVHWALKMGLMKKSIWGKFNLLEMFDIVVTPKGALDKISKEIVTGRNKCPISNLSKNVWRLACFKLFEWSSSHMLFNFINIFSVSFQFYHWFQQN